MKMQVGAKELNGAAVVLASYAEVTDPIMGVIDEAACTVLAKMEDKRGENA